MTSLLFLLTRILYAVSWFFVNCFHAVLNFDCQVELRGPSDLSSLVYALKSFIPHAAICAESFGSSLSSNVEAPTVPSLSEAPFFVCKSAVVSISAVLLQPSILADSYVKPSDVSVVYICELSEIKGKFHKEKAEALGLDVGPKRRELQNGKSVKSDRLDIMVRSNMSISRKRNFMI